MTCVADKLPIEILSSILSYLTASDVKSAAVVSRKWYEACQTPYVARKLRLVFSSGSNLQDIVAVMQQRNVYDVHISSLEGPIGSKSAFSYACTHNSLFGNVERLSLRGCDISESLLYALLSCCPSLISLDLSCCNNLFMSGQLLKDLHLKNTGINDSNSSSEINFHEKICADSVKDCNSAGSHHSSKVRNLIGKIKQKLAINLTTVSSSEDLVRVRSNIESRCVYGSHSSASINSPNSSRSNENINLMNAIEDSLEGVKELKLASLRYLSDVTFSRLMSACPHLTHLSLCNNSILFHTDVLYSGSRVNDRCTNSSEVQQNAGNCRCEIVAKSKPNSAVLSFSCVLSFIADRVGTLTSLDFSRTSIKNEHLRKLVELEGLKLQELFLIACSDLSDSGIISVATNQPSIRVLDLSDCLLITDKAIDSICEGLTELTKLSIDKCRQITDKSACHLQSLKMLKQLDMNSCFMVTSRSLSIAVSKCLHLTELSLARCTSVGDEIIYALTRPCHNLVKLDLSSCNLTDLGVLQLHVFFPHSLRHLRLAWCSGISDLALLGWNKVNINCAGTAASVEVDPCEHHELGDGLCRCTRKNQVSNIFNAPQPRKPVQKALNNEVIGLSPDITALKKLRTLDLSSCGKLTDNSLSQIMSFPELTSLHLSLCRQVTDKTLDAIWKGIPTLERLSIAQCHKVTDDGVIRLIENLKRLRHLDISSCEQLTSRTIEALYVHSRCLQELDVSLCPLISAQSVEMLENDLRSLHVVHKRMIGSKAF